MPTSDSDSIHAWRIADSCAWIQDSTGPVYAAAAHPGIPIVLQDTAADIWMTLGRDPEHARTTASIAEELAPLYGVAAKDICSQIDDLLTDLETFGIVRVEPEAQQKTISND